MLQTVTAGWKAAMDDGELPRVLRLLWGREERRRGPRPAYTIDDIAVAAVQVADEHGLAGVSMNAVAEQLGVSAMALYRYVDSKADLYVAMVDAAYGPPPARRPSGGWRAQLAAWAAANRGALRRHGWIVQIPVHDPPLAPNQLRWMERGLAAFARTPLTEQQKLSSLLLVEVYVRGQVLLSSQLGDSLAQDAAGSDARYASRLAALVNDREFPAVHAALMSGSLADDGEFADEEFRFGLDTVLDGIAARIARRPKAR